MALLIPAEPRSRSNLRLLPTWWPLAAITVGFPIWWALGLSAAAWPLVSTAVMLPRLISSRRQLKLPVGFGWWMLFMVWVVLSATQINELSRIFSFGYRFSVYIAATIVFIYLYNETEERMPTKRVIGAAHRSVGLRRRRRPHWCHLPSAPVHQPGRVRPAS